MPAGSQIQNLSQGTTFGPGEKAFIGPFITVNLATNQSAVAVAVANVGGTNGVVMPFAGSVIGVTCTIGTALTAGSLTAFATVNGTTVLSSGAFASGAGNLTKYVTQANDVDTFAAGAKIGVKFTSSADMAPTTNDPVAYVIVEQ